MEEIWKDIVGYEGRYKISNLGRVWVSGKYVDGRVYKDRILPLRLDKWGYPIVTLYKKGISKTVKVHRLVAIAFIPNPNNYPCVDHINTDKKDNRVENLSWCTYKMNANNHLTKEHLSAALKRVCNSSDYKKRQSERMKKNIENVMSKVRIPILQYSLNGDFIQEFPSTVDAAKSVNGNATSISRNCRGKRPTAYGYIWKYKNHGRIRDKKMA